MRAQARAEHTKPTQLIRRWIEEHRTTGQPSLEERVRRIEDLIQRATESIHDLSGTLSSAEEGMHPRAGGS